MQMGTCRAPVSSTAGPAEEAVSVRAQAAEGNADVYSADEEAGILERLHAVERLLDGRAAALWGGAVGWLGFTAVSNGPARARFIASAYVLSKQRSASRPQDATNRWR